MSTRTPRRQPCAAAPAMPVDGLRARHGHPRTRRTPSLLPKMPSPFFRTCDAPGVTWTDGGEPAGPEQPRGHGHSGTDTHHRAAARLARVPPAPPAPAPAWQQPFGGLTNWTARQCLSLSAVPGRGRAELPPEAVVPFLRSLSEVSRFHLQRSPCPGNFCCHVTHLFSGVFRRWRPRLRPGAPENPGHTAQVYTGGLAPCLVRPRSDSAPLAPRPDVHSRSRAPLPARSPQRAGFRRFFLSRGLRDDPEELNGHPPAESGPPRRMSAQY